MKTLLPLTLLLSLPALTACVTAREVDTEKAFQKCQTINDKNFRDRCISEALQDAQRVRNEIAEDIQEDIDDAERRELERAKAGLPQD